MAAGTGGNNRDWPAGANGTPGGHRDPPGTEGAGAYGHHGGHRGISGTGRGTRDWLIPGDNGAVRSRETPGAP